MEIPAHLTKEEYLYLITVIIKAHGYNDKITAGVINEEAQKAANDMLKGYYPLTGRIPNGYDALMSIINLTKPEDKFCCGYQWYIKILQEIFAECGYPICWNNK